MGGQKDGGLWLQPRGGPWWGEAWLIISAAAIPMVPDRYYADIRQTVPASDQEMNSILAELSRVWPSLCFLGWAQVSHREDPALLPGSPGDISNPVSWLGWDPSHQQKCGIFQ